MAIPRRCSAALVLVLLARSSHCLRDYEKTADLPGGPATVSWTVSETSVSLALVVEDAGVAGGTLPWLGLGIGDPQSGGMLGADIATAISDGAGSCTIQDRHVPSVSYPLGDSKVGSGVFPVEDTCGTSAWELVSCKIDIAAGTLILEVDRALAAQNVAEDRQIDKEKNIVLVAWGDGFGYHGGKRLTVEVDFTLTGRQAVGGLTLAQTGLTPKDVVASQELLIGNYTIPSKETTYMCVSFEINRPASGGGRQVVAVEPVLDFTKEYTKRVHHYVLYSCETGGVFDMSLGNPIPCEDSSPICRDVVYAWAKGQGPLLYPENAGFPVSDKERFYTLQVHYDNPLGLEGVVDAGSGIRLHFTDTPREQDAGTINLGDPYVQWSGQPVLSNFNYSFDCPNECLGQLAKPVKVFSSFLHAHLSGMQLWTNLYRDGAFLKTIEATAYWSNENQRNTLLEEVEIRSTDRLVLGGNFDVEKRVAAGETVTWGLGTRNEMLMTFLFVTPRPMKKSGIGLNFCGIVEANSRNLTMCTDGVSFNPEGGDLIFADPFETSKDDVGFSTDFGGPVQCLQGSGPSTLPSTTTTGSGESDVSSSSADDNSRECFPSDAVVTLESGRYIPMHGLAVGDRVLVDTGVYSEVSMFTHRLHYATSKFVQLSIEEGHELTLTPGHYVPIQGRLLAAKDISIGDRVFNASGHSLAVVRKELVRATGLYNPQTSHGNIVVNDIVASTYTTAIPPVAAHAMGSILARIFRAVGFHLTLLETDARVILTPFLHAVASLAPVRIASWFG